MIACSDKKRINGCVYSCACAARRRAESRDVLRFNICFSSFSIFNYNDRKLRPWCCWRLALVATSGNSSGHLIPPTGFLFSISPPITSVPSTDRPPPRSASRAAARRTAALCGLTHLFCEKTTTQLRGTSLIAFYLLQRKYMCITCVQEIRLWIVYTF